MGWTKILASLGFHTQKCSFKGKICILSETNKHSDFSTGRLSNSKDRKTLVPEWRERRNEEPRKLENTWLILSKHWLYKRVLWSLRKRQRLRENCSGDPSLLDLNLYVTTDHVYNKTGDMTSPQTLKQGRWGKTTNNSNIFMILESVWKGKRKQQKSIWNTWEQQTPIGSYRKPWKTSWEQHLKLRGGHPGRV